MKMHEQLVLSLRKTNLSKLQTSLFSVHDSCRENFKNFLHLLYCSFIALSRRLVARPNSAVHLITFRAI